MSSATLITVSEYLATSYRPDRDYIDGQVLERNLGEYDHSRLQTRLTSYFLVNFESVLGLITMVQQRVQVKPTRFRIPDITVTRGEPGEQIITHPPFLCVEILSPEDSLNSIQERIDDYLDFGVENIWILDPQRKKAFRADRNGIHEAANAILEIPDTIVRVDLTEFWPS